jgi:signal transduction histidine kinase
MQMQIELLFLLFVFLFQLAIGGYILIRNPWSRLARRVTAICLMIAFWSLNDIFFNLIPEDSKDLAILSARILWCAIFMLPAVFYDFACEVIGSISPLQRRLKYVFYLFGLLLCLANQVLPIRLDYLDYRFISMQALILKHNLIYMYIPLALALWFLYRSYSRAASEEKHRLWPFFLASLIAVLFPAFFNGLSIVFQIAFPVPLGFVGFIIFPVITARALVRQGSLDIYEVPRRERLQSMLSTILLGFYFLFIYYTVSLVKSFSPFDSTVVESVLFLALVYSFFLLKSPLDRFSAWVIKAIPLTELLERLETFQERIGNSQTVNEVFAWIAQSLVNVFQVKKLTVARYRELTWDFVIENSEGLNNNMLGQLELDHESPVIKRLIAEQKPIIGRKERLTEESEYTKAWRRLLDYFNLEVIIPIVHGRITLGFALIGRKLNDDALSDKEIDMVFKQIFRYAGMKLAALKEKQEKEKQYKGELIEHGAKGLVKDLAHHLKNALGFASARLSKYMEEMKDPESRKAFSKIRDAIESSKEKARRALYPSPMAEFSLNDILPAAVKSIGDHNLEIIFDLSPSLPLFRGYRERLEGAFQNLVQNARDASQPGGKIWVRSGIASDEKGGSCLKATIEDEGKGISPENIEKIFELFFTTKEDKPGSGIGLFYAHQVIDEHQGRFLVKSQPGKGTVIQVFLPLSLSGTSGEKQL